MSFRLRQPCSPGVCGTIPSTFPCLVRNRKNEKESWSTFFGYFWRGCRTLTAAFPQRDVRLHSARPLRVRIEGGASATLVSLLQSAQGIGNGLIAYYRTYG